jgi:hypothetical protein
MKITITANKKIMLAAILTSGLTLAISQAAISQPSQPAAAHSSGQTGGSTQPVPDEHARCKKSMMQVSQ